MELRQKTLVVDVLTDRQEKIKILIDSPLSKTGPDRVTYLENTALGQAGNKLDWNEDFGKTIQKLLETLEDLERHQKQGLSPGVYEVYCELINVCGKADREYFHKNLSIDERDKKNRKYNNRDYIILSVIFIVLLLLWFIPPFFQK